MWQTESSNDSVQRRKNFCLRDAFVFLLWHTSRPQPITDWRPMSVKSWQSSARYCGSWPCNALCTRTASLKSMRCRTCNTQQRRAVSLRVRRVSVLDIFPATSSSFARQFAVAGSWDPQLPTQGRHLDGGLRRGIYGPQGLWTVKILHYPQGIL